MLKEYANMCVVNTSRSDVWSLGVMAYTVFVVWVREE